MAVPTAKPQNSETIIEKYCTGSKCRKDSTGSQGIGLPKTTPTKPKTLKKASKTIRSLTKFISKKGIQRGILIICELKLYIRALFQSHT